VAILRNSFEGGTNTTVLSTGNTGGTSGDAANLIVGSPTFSSTRSVSGSLSMRIAADSVAQQFRWNGLSLSKFKARMYFYYDGLQSTDNYLFVTAVGGTRTIICNVNGANKLRLYTAAGTGTTIWTATNALSAGSWYRLECYGNGLSASTADVKVAYFPVHGTTPTEAYDGTGVSNTGLTAFDNVIFGKQNAATVANDLYVDEVALDTDPSSDYTWPLYTAMPRTPLPSAAVARAANY
jgi:hypothetical protein